MFKSKLFVNLNKILKKDANSRLKPPAPPFLQVKGGRPLHGTIELSGDTLSAEVLLILSLFGNKKVTLSNMPRSARLLNFLEVLEKLGVRYRWINVDEVMVSPVSAISNDLSEVDSEYFQNEILMLIPLVIFHEGRCTVSSGLRSEAGFYRKLGFNLEVKPGGKLLIEKPVFKRELEKNTFDLRGLDVSTANARIFLKFAYRQLKFIAPESDALLPEARRFPPDKSGGFLLQESMEAVENGLKRRYKAGVNVAEFELLAVATILTKGECGFKNYNLTRLLGFLLVLREFGASYEVVSNELKIWYEGKKLETHYDFSHLDELEVSLAIILLSGLAKKEIKIVVSRFDSINKMIKELNIYGAKLEIQPDTKYPIISVRPTKALLPVRSDIPDEKWALCSVLIALYVNKVSRIKNPEVLLDRIYTIIEDLEGLHADIAT